MASWQAQRAKSHFSELLDKAVSEGPQTITRHGAETAVLVSAEDYRRLTGNTPNIIDVLLGGPKFPDGTFDFERHADAGRDIDHLFDE